MYMAVFGSCTAVYRVRTRREQPCTRAVNTPGYRVHGRSDGHRQWTRTLNTPVYMITVYWPCSGHGRTMYTALARRCTRSVHGPGHVLRGYTGVYMPCLRPVPVFMDTGRNAVNAPRCRRPVDGLYTTEAEAKAEAWVIITRPGPAIFVYSSVSTDLLGQRDLLRSFETANYLILCTLLWAK